MRLKFPMMPVPSSAMIRFTWLEQIPVCRDGLFSHCQGLCDCGIDIVKCDIDPTKRNKGWEKNIYNVLTK